ncbi:chemotaxis protein CheY [Coprothermobacter proteolyticus DSM 5265]|uniref:Putative chemotaxis protein CheY n=1 Tax=Coprothermobacter proteolyticus (strain ATCC 35245 / DSM 5265 / OCM 4 / BT) TaxID=309798 RepID=B5Y7F1_COPPD|nr:response regulator [Coprothermobacter proteolyticus]ACI16989.1 chemotaxis protein CheY [Coprothermobacter proteolyticus DSM 5265]
MSKRVLIVDDAAFMRMMIKNVLTQNGYEVAGEASNGQEALVLYEKVKPDLVTLDITMPEMDGIQTLKELLKMDPSANVIMVTAMGQQQLVIEAIQVGAKDFVVKPFQPDRLIEAVRKALGDE